MKKSCFYLSYIFYKVYKKSGKSFLLIAKILKAGRACLLRYFFFFTYLLYKSLTTRLPDQSRILNQDHVDQLGKNVFEQISDVELISYYQNISGRKIAYSRKNPQQILTPNCLTDYFLGDYLTEDD